RHTRFSRDWSSDVCSSDLTRASPGELWLALLLPPNVDLPALRPHQPLLECALAGEPFDDLSEPPTAPVLIGEEAGIGAILFLAEIGRAPCRERVEMWVGAG